MVQPEYQALVASQPPLALEHCTSAGEPLDKATIDVWSKLVTLEIKEGYGQTETILLCGNFSSFPTKPGSMGKPCPGVTLAVLTDDLKQAANGVEGNLGVLLAQTPSSTPFYGLFDGYLSRSGQVTRKVQVHAEGTPHQQSWFLTGDHAYRDGEGYIWFVGRADDVINSSGYRIGPFEVEATLNQHPSVVESAVIAAPDVERGEVVKAFVVLHDDAKRRAGPEFVKELQDFCKRTAAPYKYPRQIQFVDNSDLPRTTSGKVKRAELKRVAWGEWSSSRRDVKL